MGRLSNICGFEIHVPIVITDARVLQHGLKGLLRQVQLILPGSRSRYPSREALAWRPQVQVCKSHLTLLSNLCLCHIPCQISRLYNHPAFCGR